MILYLLPMIADAPTHFGCGVIDPVRTGIATDSKSVQTYILLIDRGGGCTFTHKVKQAERLSHVVSVIAVDDRDEWNGRLPLMADDGTGGKIGIPSVLISKTDGDKLKSVITTIDSKTNKATVVSMSLTYQLPAPDNRVEIDLWTSSFDPQSKIFKSNFGPAIRTLGDHALFTPHYYIIPGEAFGCDLPGNVCGNQCTNNGKYCTWDPERDIDHGLSGAQVLAEDLRRICLYKTINSTQPNPSIYQWFDYVNMFEDTCADAPDYKNWNDQCSYNIMNKFSIDTNSVQECIAASGGLDTDTNIEFDEQRRELENYGGNIIRIPWLLINNAPAFGSIQCLSPLSQSTCAPLNGVCHGYASGTEPDACKTADYDYECNYSGYLPSPPSSMCGGNSITGHKLSWSSVFGIILLVLTICGCAGAAAYLYITHEKKQMRDDIDQLLKQYLPLNDNDSLSHNNGSKYHMNSRLLDDQADDEV